jgi:hypothetical protein
MKTLKAMVIEYLDNAGETEIKDLFNRYCEVNSYGETIWQMCEFQELSGCDDKPFMETFDLLDDGFCSNHSYFVQQDNGYYKSFNAVTDFLEECYVSDLANWIIREGESREFSYELNEILENAEGAE